MGYADGAFVIREPLISGIVWPSGIYGDLTNRVHPTRKNEKIRAFRPLIHDVVFQEIVSGTK
jgi:hypothetical protein